MNSLPDIMARLSDRLAFKILVVTCCLCLTVLVLLQVVMIVLGHLQASVMM